MLWSSNPHRPHRQSRAERLGGTRGSRVSHGRSRLGTRKQEPGEEPGILKGEVVKVGVLSDGRDLLYDEAGLAFSAGTDALSVEQVKAYDLLGQVAWVSEEMRTWANALPTPSSNQGPSQGDSPASVTDQQPGWFTRLPLWGKVFFILVWPVSITYGLVVMWKDKRFEQPVRIGLTVAGVLFLGWAFTLGGNDSSVSNPPKVEQESVAADKPAEAEDEVKETASTSEAAKDKETPVETKPVAPAEPSFREVLDEAFGSFTVVAQSGKGDGVVTLPTGNAAIVTATHSGSGNFAVWTLDAANQEDELLVNEIGNYSGATFYYSSAAPVKLKISAGGSWSVNIAPVSSAPGMGSPASGAGDAVLIYEGKAADWSLTHSGDSNFVVKYIGMDSEDLLVNEIGAYNGVIPVSKGPAVIIINADGNWSITTQ